jgi:hypothetical protein
MPKPTNYFTDSDHLFAYHIHLNTKKERIELKESDFKLIALSRKVKRTLGSWSRKIMNFDVIRDGGSQHGNAHEVYKTFKARYDKNPTLSIQEALAETIPISEKARNLFVQLLFPESKLPPTNTNPKPLYFGVIGKGDIFQASKQIDKGKIFPGFNDSTTYDVIIDDKIYPPKLLIALAYKTASGYEIKGEDFDGGLGTPCFETLNELGFTPVNKTKPAIIYPPENRKMKNLNEQILTSIAAKPFMILAGGTGTGKTRTARQLAIQIAGEDNVATVAVGSDWTDNRPLLGFRNLFAEGGKTYVAPPALRIILKALNNPGKPYFLILDEMNLSHVERYFADFLSSMESKEPLKIHDSGEAHNTEDGISVDGKIDWPKNLFVIGTVNIDETTYMFSPKVLDRAHVIEFKVSWQEIVSGLKGAVPSELPALRPEQIDEFMRVAFIKDKSLSHDDHTALIKVLEDLHRALEGSRFLFAHRTARECLNFIASSQSLAKAEIVSTQEINALIDLAILQKVLPKLNGSAGSLSKNLDSLVEFSAKHKLTNCETKLKSMSEQLKNDQFVSFIQ